MCDRNLHNDELHGLCSSPDTVKVIKSMRMNWAGHVALMGEVYEVLIGWKRPLGRPRRRWEDNIKIDFREMGIRWGEMDSALSR
jgi:hypothetical protein